MERVIRNIGILIIFIAILILSIYLIFSKSSNALLGTSAILIIVGLLSYIVLQKYYN